jgi:hypothetical protein
MSSKLKVFGPLANVTPHTITIYSIMAPVNVHSFISSTSHLPPPILKVQATVMQS